MNSKSSLTWLNNISPAQKKIIIVVFTGALAFLASWMFIYLPARGSVNRVRQELGIIENKIQGIEGKLGKNKSMEAGLRLLQEESFSLTAKFPSKEEESIKTLSDLAAKGNVEIISLRPEAKANLLGEGEKKIEMEGLSCYKVPINMEIKCTYQGLVEYLISLKESTLADISVERLKINKDASGAGRLNINLDINLYLLS